MLLAKAEEFCMNTCVRLSVVMEVATRLALNLSEVSELRKRVDQLERQRARRGGFGADYKNARAPFGSRASLRENRTGHPGRPLGLRDGRPAAQG
jgi:hypothetical protein